MNDLESRMTDEEIRGLAGRHGIDPDRFLVSFLEVFPTRQMNANTICKLPSILLPEKMDMPNTTHSLTTKVKEDVQ